MKNVILIALFCAGQILNATAQNSPTNTTNSTIMNRTAMSDYEKMLQNQSKVDFRTQAVKTLGLTEQQIKDFDPLFNSYMNKKNELAQKRMKLLTKYVDEVAENDSPRNEENDKEEFLEDYLELQVKEMDLRKEYFDKMEDVISADKAFGFYIIEDMASNKIYLQILEPQFAPFISSNYGSSTANSTIDRSNMNQPKASPHVTNTGQPDPSKTTGAPTSPTNLSTPSVDSTHHQMNTMPNATASSLKAADTRYRTEISTYSNWSKNTKVDVGGSHQYTRDGLNNLVNAISSLSMACNMATDNNYASNKNKIMANMVELKKDAASTKHAGLMRESFISAADMLKSVQQKCNQPASTTSVEQVAEAARKIDVNNTTNSQQQLIQDFFRKAQIAIDGMASSITWSGK